MLGGVGGAETQRRLGNEREVTMKVEAGDRVRETQARETRVRDRETRERWGRGRKTNVDTGTEEADGERPGNWGSPETEISGEGRVGKPSVWGEQREEAGVGGRTGKVQRKR